MRIFSIEIHYDCPEEHHVGCDVLKTHFGCTAGSGAAIPSAQPLSASVPEPATLVLLMFAAAGCCCRGNQRMEQHLATPLVLARHCFGSMIGVRKMHFTR